MRLASLLFSLSLSLSLSLTLCMKEHPSHAFINNSPNGDGERHSLNVNLSQTEPIRSNPRNQRYQR